MLNRNELNPLSSEFADHLFRTYPEWDRFAENQDGGVLDVKVPQAGTDRYLWISTQDDELTVGYDHWHDHLGSFLGLSSAEAIEQAMDEIRAIIDEEQIVMISFRNGKWVRSMHAKPGAAPAMASGGTTYIYSWRRTYDRILDGVPEFGI